MELSFIVNISGPFPEFLPIEELILSLRTDHDELRRLWVVELRISLTPMHDMEACRLFLVDERLFLPLEMWTKHDIVERSFSITDLIPTNTRRQSSQARYHVACCRSETTPARFTALSPDRRARVGEDFTALERVLLQEKLRVSLRWRSFRLRTFLKLWNPFHFSPTNQSLRSEFTLENTYFTEKFRMKYWYLRTETNRIQVYYLLRVTSTPTPEKYQSANYKCQVSKTLGVK